MLLFVPLYQAPPGLAISCRSVVRGREPRWPSRSVFGCRSQRSGRIHSIPMHHLPHVMDVSGVRQAQATGPEAFLPPRGGPLTSRHRHTPGPVTLSLSLSQRHQPVRPSTTHHDPSSPTTPHTHTAPTQARQQPVLLCATKGAYLDVVGAVPTGPRHAIVGFKCQANGHGACGSCHTFAGVPPVCYLRHHRKESPVSRDGWV